MEQATEQKSVYEINGITQQTMIDSVPRMYAIAETAKSAVDAISQIDDYISLGDETLRKAALVHWAMMLSKDMQSLYELYGFTIRTLNESFKDGYTLSPAAVLDESVAKAAVVRKEIDGALTAYNKDAADLPSQFGITADQYQCCSGVLIEGMLNAMSSDWDVTTLVTLMNKAAVRRSFAMLIAQDLHKDIEKMNKILNETTIGILYPFIMQERIRMASAKADLASA